MGCVLQRIGRKAPAKRSRDGDLASRVAALENAIEALCGIVQGGLGGSPLECLSEAALLGSGLVTKLTPDMVTRSIWQYGQAYKPSPAMVRLAPDGGVGLYTHPNEAKWRLDEGVLSFVTLDGAVSTTFDQLQIEDGRIVLRGRYRLVPDADLVLQLVQLRPTLLKPSEIVTCDYLKPEIEVFGWRIGAHTYGRPSIIQSGPSRLSIGRYCSIADGVEIVLESPRSTAVANLPSSLSRAESGARPSDTGTPAEVTIGHDVVIGPASTVLSGVTVGNGAVVGAATVVSTDVPAYGVVTGSPARLIGFRFPDDVVSRLQEVAWWNWTDEVVAQRYDLIVSDDPYPLIDSAATA